MTISNNDMGAVVCLDSHLMAVVHALPSADDAFYLRSWCVCAQNVVQYTGSKADREIIRKHEFHFDTKDRSKKKRYKFDVLLVSSPSFL